MRTAAGAAIEFSGALAAEVLEKHFWPPSKNLPHLRKIL
jgi:hypothetical protein